jgi:hypothetical protein
VARNFNTCQYVGAWSYLQASIRSYGTVRTAALTPDSRAIGMETMWP